MIETTIIVPCAGRSSRYPNLRPKFLLVNPNGNLMLIDAISKLNLKNCKVIVTALKEHAEKYDIRKIFKFFSPPHYSIKVCVLEKPTNSQSETIYLTLKKENIKGPFLVKDCDNIFRLHKVNESFNYIAVEKLDNLSQVHASNKSYVIQNKEGYITEIKEKKIISNIFSVGGYYFINPQNFIEAFEKLSQKNLDQELYISFLINYLLENKIAQFKTKFISEYLDLGTIKEWLDFKNTIKTYFIDIDGVLVENSGEYYRPFWGTSKPIKENIELVQKLYKSGNQIILVTSRKESYRKITLSQLRRNNLKFHKLIMGVYHSQRVIINDFASSNPYPCTVAINIPRDSNKLNEYIDSIR